MSRRFIKFRHLAELRMGAELKRVDAQCNQAGIDYGVGYEITGQRQHDYKMGWKDGYKAALKWFEEQLAKAKIL